MEALALLVCRVSVNIAQRKEMPLAYGAFARELEGQSGGFSSCGHSGRKEQCMGADLGGFDGGVDVKPRSNGRVHALYAASLCKKPSLTTGGVSTRRDSGKSTFCCGHRCKWG